MNQQCPDCGADLSETESCETFFHQMLFWENEDPANWRVHHLMVLCYHLQHPALYSPEGLTHSRQLLKRFIVEGLSPEQVRQQSKKQVASINRDWKITSTADSHGSYDFPVKWRMNAADVVAGGIENYCENVERWANSIYRTLEGNNG
ncbi:MAG: DUF5946 family protein [Candidatus Promineifilaceae bacterium]